METIGESSEKIIDSIPFVDLKTQIAQIRPEIYVAMEECIDQVTFIGGSPVREFEKAFAAFCKAKHCIGVGNGTDALFIALKAAGIGIGDEVLIPANTFVATSEAVSMTGARVVFVDCDPDTCNIDMNLMASKLTPRTKAIIPVHLYGQPANLPIIREFAKSHGLIIIQDCAQAHGATIDGRSLVDFGGILCFSFYPGKNLGALGDAGAIVTNNDDMAKKMAMFANHGRMEKYNHEFEGINSRLDSLQAAILRVKLKYLPGWNENRQNIAKLYREKLRSVPGVQLISTLPNVSHVYHLFVVRVNNRTDLINHLKKNGIATGIHYPIALPYLKAYRYLGHKPEDFPVAFKYQDEILSLPMYPEMTEEMVENVACLMRK
jgi:dTDP-4-amino-4,6-dideoxygalactose transaminase